MAEHSEDSAQKHTAASGARQRQTPKRATTGMAGEAGVSVREGLSETGDVLQRESPNLLTAGLVVAGVAIVQPELIPGLLIGAGATLAPKLLPAVGTILRPLVKAAVKTGYEITSDVREAAAEVREQMEDMVAEAHAERDDRMRRHAEEPETRSGRSAHPQPA